MSLETRYCCHSSLDSLLSLGRVCVVWDPSLMALSPLPGPDSHYPWSTRWVVSVSGLGSGILLPRAVAVQYKLSYTITLLDASVTVWISNQQKYTYWSFKMNYYQHVCWFSLKTCNMCVPSHSRQFTTPDIQLGREIHIGLVLSNQQFLENFKLTFSFSFH